MANEIMLKRARVAVVRTAGCARIGPIGAISGHNDTVTPTPTAL